MKIKKLLAAVSAALMMTGAVLPVSAANNLYDLITLETADAEDKPELWSIGGCCYYMSQNYEYRSGNWHGITEDGTINFEYDIDDSVLDGNTALGEMGVWISDLPDEGYPYEMQITEAEFIPREGEAISIDSIKAVTEWEEDEDYQIKIRIRPVDYVDSFTGELLCKAVPEVSGMEKEGAFKGGVLRITVDFLKPEMPDFVYSELEDGTMELSRYYGKDETVIVPETAEGKKVTRIGNGAFKYRKKIQSITLPESITEIGNSAFYKCTGLMNINIPDGVTKIGSSAFSRCSSLESIVLPENISKINGYTFENCTSLKSVILPDCNEVCVKEAAFINCGLESITVPANYANIEEYSFGYTMDYETFVHSKIENFMIFCTKDSAAEQYAIENGFKYEYLPETKPGDANGDGKVNMKDLVLIQRYLNGWPIDIDLTACDLTGDGKVNMKDYVALQRQLNGWTV